MDKNLLGMLVGKKPSVVQKGAPYGNMNWKGGNGVTRDFSTGDKGKSTLPLVGKSLALRGSEYDWKTGSQRTDADWHSTNKEEIQSKNDALVSDLSKAGFTKVGEETKLGGQLWRSADGHTEVSTRFITSLPSAAGGQTTYGAIASVYVGGAKPPKDPEMKGEGEPRKYSTDETPRGDENQYFSAWMDKKTSENSDLTPAQRDASLNYTTAYLDINPFLRGTGIPEGHDGHKYPLSAEERDTTIKTLDGMMQPLGKDVVLGRGVGPEPARDLVQAFKDGTLIGRTFEDKAYLSTTYNTSQGLGFFATKVPYKDGKEVIVTMKIHADREVKGLFMPGSNDLTGEDMEVVLARNTPVHITGASLKNGVLELQGHAGDYISKKAENTYIAWGDPMYKEKNHDQISKEG